MDKRWHQIRWNAERTDNISAVNLEDAYAQAWHIGHETSGSPIQVDAPTIDIEDMVTGRTYRVPVEYLESDLTEGWSEFARRQALLEPRLDAILSRKQAG